MSTAAFLKSDDATQGTWYSGTHPVYGADGYGIIGQGASADGDVPLTQGYFDYPSYATVTIGSGTLAHCWSYSTNAAKALEYAPPGTSNGSDSNRVAAAWYGAAPSSFTIDVQDGNAHQIALYMLDYENAGRVQQIQITDDLNGNAVLDTRTVSSFGNGVWLLWSVSGKVSFTITPETGGTSAVISGIFFDTPIGTIFPAIISRPRIEPAYFE